MDKVFEVERDTIGGKVPSNYGVNKVRKAFFSGIIINVILGIFALAMLLPLYCALLNSFKDTSTIARYPFALVNLNMDNYLSIFSSANYAKVLLMYKNSIVITFVSVVIVVLLASMGGYYLARSKNKLADGIAVLFLVGMMIPDEITLIPLVKLFMAMGLTGKVYGMFVYYAGHNTALSIFLYSKFIKMYPIELEESAHIDGANRFQIFYRIIFPLLKPCTATVIIFVGVNIWNDFMMPLYLLRGNNAITITLAMYSALGGQEGSNWGMVFAFVVVASVPVLILYLLMQKWFISSLTSGALKG